MKRLLKFSVAMILMVALLVPMFTVSAAAATKWNGTSAIKDGKNYVISSSITMDSKFTVPAKSTVTIAKGGSLTISKGVTASINGTLSVSNGGSLTVNGTLNTSEKSSLKVAGKFTYSGSAKIKINGAYSVTSTGTVTGNSSTEINLSAKSQYNSDMEKINTYLEKKNYSKACSLLENAISSYPDKKSTLQKVYSSAVIDWADQTADKKDYARASSILNSSKQFLSDTTDVQNRYNLYQSYIPVRLSSLTPWEGRWRTEVVGEDSLGNQYKDAGYLYDDTIKFKIDGKFTNFKATIAYFDSGSTYSSNRTLRIYADDVLVYESDILERDTPPISIDIDITGATYITLDGYILIGSATLYKE